MYKALVVYVWGIVDRDLVLFVMIVFLHSLFSHSQISTLNTRLSCPHIYSQYNSTYWRHVKTVFTLLPTSWNAGHLFTRVSFHSMCCVSDYSEHVVTGSPTLSLIQSMASSHSRRYCTSFCSWSRFIWNSVSEMGRRSFTCRGRARGGRMSRRSTTFLLPNFVCFAVVNDEHLQWFISYYVFRAVEGVN